MTRINCIPVEELTQPHLVAEYRELPRVFGMVHGMIERGTTDPALAAIPSTYRMGPGHMKFFTDKLGYLVKRQRALVDEMVRRGYKPSHTNPEALLDNFPSAFCNDWTPSEADMAVSRARIQERLSG